MPGRDASPSRSRGLAGDLGIPTGHRSGHPGRARTWPGSIEHCGHSALVEGQERTRSPQLTAVNRGVPASTDYALRVRAGVMQDDRRGETGLEAASGRVWTPPSPHGRSRTRYGPAMLHVAGLGGGYLPRGQAASHSRADDSGPYSAPAGKCTGRLVPAFRRRTKPVCSLSVREKVGLCPRAVRLAGCDPGDVVRVFNSPIFKCARRGRTPLKRPSGSAPGGPTCG